MSAVHALVAALQSKDVRVWADGEALRYDAPAGVLTAVDLAQLREHKAALMEFLRQTARPEPPLRAGPRPAVLPLSVAQQRLWFISQLPGAAAAYHVPAALKLRGELDCGALQRALDTLVARHEVLRTVFVVNDGQPAQSIAEPAQFQLSTVDLRGQDRSAVAVERLALAEAGAPFDLSKGPLIRGRLLRLAAHEHVLLVTLHHIVSDGWSMGILVREFTALYAAYRAGAADSLPAPALQYADYALWQQQWLRSTALRQQLDFWKTYLQGAPAYLDLPTDRARPAVQTYNGGVVDVALDAPLCNQLKQLAADCEMTLFTLLLTVWRLLLARWTQCSDIVIGTVVAGRHRPELEAMVGCCMNFVAVRGSVQPGDSVAALLAQASRAMVDVYARQECPFDKVVEAVNPARTLAHNPIFNVGFLLQNHPSGDLELAGLELAGVLPPLRKASLDLRVTAVEQGNTLALQCEYSTDLFFHDTVEFLMADLRSVCAQVCATPEQRVAQLALSSQLVERAASARTRARPRKVAVAGNFTVEPLADPLRFWSETLAMPWEIEFTPYGQSLQQLLDPTGAFAANSCGFNILVLSVTEWTRALTAPVSERLRVAAATARDVVDAATKLRSVSAVPLLVYVAPRTTGPIPCDLPELDVIEQTLIDGLRGIAGVQCLTHAGVLRRYPVAVIEDAHSNALGHIPYTDNYFAAMGTALARCMASFVSTPYKVVVVDCDNTLWRGVCAEDGAAGVKIEAAQLALQDYLLRLREAGMLVCLCSKNELDDVRAVFEQRSDMPLRWEHIAALRVNWQSKSANLASLASELGLALDSFVFIDDNPVECAEVGARCQGVLVLPPAGADCADLLDHVWAFDRVEITDDARLRADRYRENKQREAVRAHAGSFADFLARLQLRVQVTPMQSADLPRVAELTHRTNQFNLSGVRRQVAQLQAECHAGLQALVVRVDDRFGDYGLVGAVLYRLSGSKLAVDTLLLSCRALGRGVEHELVKELGRSAARHGADTLELTLIESKRNRPAADFLHRSFGTFATAIEGGVRFDVPVEYALQLAAKIEPAKIEPAAHAAGFAVAELAPSVDAQVVCGIARETYLHIAQNLRTIADIQRTLRSRVPAGKAAHTDYVAPRNTFESELQAVWQELLKLDQIGVYDDFFKLGGHSLLATRLLARIRGQFDVDLQFADFYRDATIAAVALFLEARTYARGQAALREQATVGERRKIYI
jgi:FkbH-like protein